MHNHDGPHEAPGCGICGHPTDPGRESDPLELPGQWVEFVVLEVFGALVRFRAADGSAAPGTTVAAVLAQQLGIAPAELPGTRFRCWEAPDAEGHGVYRTVFGLLPG
ncbi:hypothetical protein AB0O91_13550 [Kitasatospora sp. NPDC089797]|uniref:hypothetical protein n=1 Tax=Kitasatospora sp. NPDC089797 TaxID=3155298 RepID=UPI003438047B